MSPFVSIPVTRVGAVEVPLPKYQTEGSAGMDLHAAIAEPIVLKPMERRMIPTGLSFAIPRGYEGQVRPRSGLAFKKGVTVINTPGTIDADYRGEVGIVLVNLGGEPAEIGPLERIAQIVFAAHATATLEWVETLDATDRGAGGYGSTGG